MRGTALPAAVFSLVTVGFFTAIGFAARPLLAEADLSMIMLLAVVIAAYRKPLRAALLAVALSVAAFDFFFVPPFYTFDVAHVKYLVTFAVMAVVGVTISSLAARVRERERAANEAKLLAETEQVRNALLSSVSHDLRTPLGSIIGAVSTLRGRELDQTTRAELLDTIEDEGRHLERVLENLLHMTRITGGSVPLRKEWQVPEEIVGTALRQLERPLGSRTVTVRIGAEVGLARFDGLLVELALLNLLDNSIKYSGVDTAIEIAVCRQDGELVWEVADEGIGLPPGQEARLFEKFYRGPGRRERGTGLGLAIAKAIVEAHHGQIWGASRTGVGGARFGFSLPLDRDAPAVPGEEAA